MEPGFTVPGQESSQRDDRMEEEGDSPFITCTATSSKASSPRHSRHPRMSPSGPPFLFQRSTCSIVLTHTHKHTQSHHDNSDRPFYSKHKMKHIRLNCRVDSFTNSRTLSFSVIVPKHDFHSVVSTDELPIANPLIALINSWLASAPCFSEVTGHVP